MHSEQLRHAQALAYIWGRRDERKDAGGNPGAVGGSAEFADWYCAVQRTEHRTIDLRYTEWVAECFPAVADAGVRRVITSPDAAALETLRRAESFAREHGSAGLADDLYALGLWLGSERSPR